MISDSIVYYFTGFYYIVAYTGKGELFLNWEYGLESGWTFKIVS